MMPGIDQQSPESIPSGNSDHVSPIKRLVHWFEAKGGELSPDVEIAFNDSNGYCCRAIKNLSSDLVAKCPLSLTLSYLNLDHAQSIVPHVDSELTKCLGHVPNNVLTYLLLVEQKLHPDKGSMGWSPYIACLPEPSSMTTPLWFNDEDMQCLAGTNLARETSVKLNKLTKEWTQSREAMTRAGVDANIFSFEWFLWAATIISSRAFISTHILPGQETFPILFPVVDILNHCSTAKVVWDFHPSQDFTLKILNHAEVRPGDEIFNNYAPKQNDELLLGYGFCVEDNHVEQFAIKIRLPPQVEQAARSMKLFEPSNIPFEMDTSFLTADDSEEPKYLRPKGHPFGRYKNRVPFFRGIPPSIVHMFFIKALMNLNMHPNKIDTQNPSSRLVLEILILLHEAIDQQSQTLTLRRQTQITFPNFKQKYATLYRDGQAKIIHAIRSELKAVIDRLRYHQEISFEISNPVIISTTEALVYLSSEFPFHAAHFKKGLQERYGIDILNWAQYSADISCLEVEDHPAELSVWKILLCLFAVLCIEGSNSEDGQPNKVISKWTQYLISQTPLPAEAAEIDAEQLQDFILGARERANEMEKAYTWADEVVDKFAFPLVEIARGEEDVQRICMYLEDRNRNENEESWVYKEPEGGVLV